MKITKVRDGKVLCHWFALCEREATDGVGHPVLGTVPCCAKCAAFARS
jgi:hypothetical protein